MKNKYEVRGDVVDITLERKNKSPLVTKVDLEDIEKVDSTFRRLWACYSQTTGSYYARGETTERRNEQLHRIVMDCPIGLVVDHIKHDTLDNRKRNLRNVTQNINMLNRHGLNKNNKHGVHGLNWHKHSGLWRVQYVPENPEWVGSRCKRVSKYFKEIEDAKKFLKSIS